LSVGDRYDLTLHGPNGFLRQFRGTADETVEVTHQYDAARAALLVSLRNAGSTALTVRTANAYAPGDVRTQRLEPGASTTDAWALALSDHWYDISATVAEDPHFLHRLAGHIETGAPSRSDPALDWPDARA
jgi:phospholipase C